MASIPNRFAVRFDSACVDESRQRVHPPAMYVFETTAVIEDASHLSLREPVPSSAARECRVIVLFESENGRRTMWPDGFFESIRIEDTSFDRPLQGSVPPIRPLDT